MTTTIIGLVFGAILLAAISVRHRMASAGKRWLDLLKAHPGRSGKARGCSPGVLFQYSDMQEGNLKQLRASCSLDTVAGDGPEIERIVNLMKWVNRLTWHHPRPRIPPPYNALRLINLNRRYRRGINCWMFALTLNEIYLAMGFASRLVHLLPHSNENRESHFVVSVYSPEAGRWLYMDPDFGGYFVDERGDLLGIPEIRRRLVAGEPLVANPDVRGFTLLLGKGSYPWYVSKNIFKYSCAQRSQFDQETDGKDKIYYTWIPAGYREELLLEPEVTKSGARVYYLNDEELFWQKPLGSDGLSSSPDSLVTKG